MDFAYAEWAGVHAGVRSRIKKRVPFRATAHPRQSEYGKETTL
jgi:hypothetical protein